MVSVNGPTVAAAASVLRGLAYAHAASRAAPMPKPSRGSGTWRTRARHIPRTVTPALANASRCPCFLSMGGRKNIRVRYHIDGGCCSAAITVTGIARSFARGT
ncbi:hypothetical protein BS47DRAFT_1128042 [Hydnum rufescens UP504]|uniref:Uncharacterized protein n=1 Tax=Hydnum rufescens UP504 TaxID=1448309 RepID=A0A9P6DSB3_9AGAM|nr:hypothetical protein BS47DRAFT_1128042 [Hydnum rufescens UP504]